MTNDDRSSDYSKHSAALRDLLSKHSALINLAIETLVTAEGAANAVRLTESKDVTDVIKIMLQGMGVSCHSIIALTGELDMRIRDCFGIARSICESAINIGYIVSGGTEIALRAKRHAFQKSYRDLNRNGDIGGISFSIGRSGPLPEPSSISGLAEALQEFSRPNGREKDWTDDNLDARIRLIGAKHHRAALDLAGATVQIYRHSSEILHGTFFGVMFFWSGGMQPAKTREQAEFILFANHTVAVYSAAIFSIAAVIEIIASEYDVKYLKTLNDVCMKKFSQYFSEELQNLEAPVTPDEEKR